MVSIYSPHSHPRLMFIVSHIFRNILGTECVLTDNKDFFLLQKGPCINYSTENLHHGIQIIPQGLLFETEVHPIENIEGGEWNGLFCFFLQEKGDIPFDLFAASFYLLTLYEEHFPLHLDEHLRFDIKESLLYRQGVLEIPVIDRWAYFLKEKLIASGGNTTFFSQRQFRVISTFDIDHPYLYRNKGFIKNVGGACKDLLKGKFRKIWERSCVLAHLRKDPYFEALHWMDAFQKSVKKSYYLFILIAKYGKYGRTTIYPQRRYFDYLNSLRDVHIGLHPSYNTLVNYKQTNKEKTKLEHLLGKEVVTTRQHFLRMQSPETFRILNKSGFVEDFTLAFAFAPGFRSGTAIPYHFYDLSKEEVTPLTIRPTVMMDSTLITHLKMSPDQALQKMKDLADACKQSGGDYLMLWHNSNLAGSFAKNPWKKIFIESYQYALSLESNTFDGKLNSNDSK